MLAGVYLLCGVALFLMLFRFQEIFSNFSIELPLATRMALAIGPVGWLCALGAVGMLVILKDLRFHSRLLNPLFAFLLGAWASFMAVALLSPIIVLTHSSIH